MKRQRLTRRDFMRTTTLAGAAGLLVPTILSPRAFARGRRSASDQITLGVIGVGIRGRNLLNGFLGDDDVRVLAVSDVDTTRREHRKSMIDEKYENTDCATYADYHELLARDDIDAIIIATPDHWHAIQIIDACNAGKDIYCEKPLTLTIHEAHTVIKAVRKHDRVFQTGSQQRTEYGGKFRKACEYIRNGRIGDVLTVHVGVGDASIWCDLPAEDMEPGLNWDRWLGPAPQRAYNSILSPRGVHDHYPRWRAYREYSGGYFTDMGAHHYDIAQWGLGRDTSGPVRVIPPEDPQSMRGATLVYDDGVRLVHGGPSGTTFIGTKGVLHVDRGRLVSVPENILEEPIGDDDEHLPAPPNHRRDWIDCMRSRSRPVCDVEVGARTITTCHLTNLAYWHRQELQWDPAEWRFVGNETANGWLDYARRDGYELPSF